MTPIPIPLGGRVLFLCDEPEKMRAQLAGQDLTAAAAGPLRHDVSTDEITPGPALTFNDARLGQYVYTGFRVGASSPIGIGAVHDGGFRVVVAGRRYGSSSAPIRIPRIRGRSAASPSAWARPTWRTRC